jgi:hypothetical protein
MAWGADGEKQQGNSLKKFFSENTNSFANG